MKAIIFILLYGSLLSSAHAASSYEADFKNASHASCDEVFHKIERREGECKNMICRDALVSQWAKCWLRSMNAELDRRLVGLKKSKSPHYEAEMELQKEFNSATEKVCGKKCDFGGGSGVKGISYNFCRVGAFKYRTTQAILMDKKEFMVPAGESFSLEKSREGKSKETAHYKSFLERLCKMPQELWKNKSVPADCEKRAAKEMDGFKFTDDVCDLS